ncbi:MAG: DUF1993 domain-containing protein [Pseudomonadota bacterium]
MSITLYDATVASYLRTLGAVKGFLGRGLDHCKEAGVDPQTLVDASLCSDMLPLRFQIKSVSHHSVGAIDGGKTGSFGPPSGPDLEDYSALQGAVDSAIAALEAVTPDEVNALAGGEVVFAVGDMKLPFTTEDFLLSFSMPNFFFHATTAYDILRQNGVPIGKLDFMGRMPIKNQ